MTLAIAGDPVWLRCAQFGLGITGQTLVILLFGFYAIRRPVLSVGALVGAGIALLFALGLWGNVRELLRLAEHGPDPSIFRLTSRRLTGDPTPAAAMVGDVRTGRGRLLATLRRERLLRVYLEDGTVHDSIWKGSSADLDELVAELKEALRLEPLST